MADRITGKIIALNISSSGDTTVISAPASGDIKVWQLALTAASSVSVTLKDGSTAQSGPYALSTTPLVLPYTGMPWAFCEPGNNFVVNLSGAVVVTGQIFYTVGS